MHIVLKNQRKEIKSFFGMVVLLFIATSVIFALGFREKENLPPVKMRVEMYGVDWAKFDKWVNVSKQALSKSDLPSRDVSMILDSLGFFQQEMYRQLNPQFKVEDSLSKIKPK